MTCDPSPPPPAPWPGFRRTMISLPVAFPPTLVLVVDTEEAFDWQRPDLRTPAVFPPAAAFHALQQVVEQRGIIPCYLLTYPVIQQPEGRQGWSEAVAVGRAVVGAHLHPWVTPPFHPDHDQGHPYPGNLPAHVERDKLACLSQTIEHQLGIRPQCYKAGRYGFGPATGDSLQALGYRVDLSPAPPFDLRQDGGPDYRAFSARPYWFGNKKNDILGLPVSGGFVGPLASQGLWLHGWLHRPWPRRLRLAGMAARSGLLQRLRLSPEGHTLAELVALTHSLLHEGVRLFQLALHSPSLHPGLLPYARDYAAREGLLQVLGDFLDYFQQQLGGVFTTPLALHQQMLQLCPPGEQP